MSNLNICNFRNEKPSNRIFRDAKKARDDRRLFAKPIEMDSVLTKNDVIPHPTPKRKPRGAFRGIWNPSEVVIDETPPGLFIMIQSATGLKPVAYCQ